MKERKYQRTVLREYLGNSSGKEQAEEIEVMKIEDIEGSLLRNYWLKLKRLRNVDADLKRRSEREGSTVVQLLSSKRKISLGMPITATPLVVLDMMKVMESPMNGFTANDCMHRSTIVELARKSDH